MYRKRKLAVFASGEGTNAEVIFQYAKAHPEQFEVSLLVSDQVDARVIERAKAYSVPSLVVPFPQDKKLCLADRKKWQEAYIWEQLAPLKIDWVCLAGYMRILSGEFLDKFWDEEQKIHRVVNIHPSLLPSFKGARAYQQAYEAGVQVSGVTLHLVEREIDAGPILLQKTFRRQMRDDFETFMAKGKVLEHALYREFLERLAQADLIQQHQRLGFEDEI